MQNIKRISRDFAKGMLLHLAYESSYMLHKLILLMALLIAVQVTLGVRAVDGFSFRYVPQPDEVYYSYSDRSYDFADKTIITMRDVCETSVIPYVFAAALAIAIVGGVAYLIYKDVRGAQRITALRTLPYPKVCGYLAKCLYAVLCVSAVYVAQICAFLILYAWDFPFHRFRTNDFLLSATYNNGGFLNLFFAPDARFFFVASILMLLTVLCFSICYCLCYHVKQSYVAPFMGVTFVLWRAVWQGNLESLSVALTVQFTVLFALLSIAVLVDTYRKY